MFPSEEIDEKNFEEFLRSQIKELEEMERELQSWMKRGKISLKMAFSELKPEDQEWIVVFRNRVFSVISIVFKGLEKVSFRLLDKFKNLVKEFLIKAFSLLSKILKLAHVESITITISAYPSISITIKP